MSLTYSRYLMLDELLSLQRLRSEGPEHDETLFIVIHQVYELWFKQVLHELDYLCLLFDTHGDPGGPARANAEGANTEESDSIPAIRHTLRRVLTILKTMVAQVDILETMTPISFNSFRSRLEAASGFQSPQFREVEFVLGQRKVGMLRHHVDNPEAHARLGRRLEEASIYQRFLAFLARLGYGVPAAALAPELRSPPEAEEIRRSLVRIYREDDRLAEICERLVDLDEGLQEWRYRHVKMVERTLGSKPGTGGSSGAAYLRATLFQPLFPDLWSIRSEL